MCSRSTACVERRGTRSGQPRGRAPPRRYDRRVSAHAPRAQRLHPRHRRAPTSPPAATTTVVTRFPPEPNGYLHIGHAKSICLNFGIAAEFGGTLPPPLRRHQPGQGGAGVHRRDRGTTSAGSASTGATHLYYASDYFEQLYEWAAQLIKNGQGLRRRPVRRGDPRAPRHADRARPRTAPTATARVEENLDLFERMRAGEFPDGARVLRAKIDMASPNINLRDPVLYRILHAQPPPHRRRVVHLPDVRLRPRPVGRDRGRSRTRICTLEFENHRPLYDWFIEHLPGAVRTRSRSSSRGSTSPTRSSRKRSSSQLVHGEARPRLGRPAHADDSRPPPPRLSRPRRSATSASASASRSRTASSRSSMLEHALRDDLNRTRRAASPSSARSRSSSRTTPRAQVEELDAVNNPEDAAGRHAQGAVLARALHRARRLHARTRRRSSSASRPAARCACATPTSSRAPSVVKDAAGNVVELRCTYDPATRGGDAPDGRKVEGDDPLGLGAARRRRPRSASTTTSSLARSRRRRPRPLRRPEPRLRDGPARTRSSSRRSRGAEPARRVQFERLGYFAADPDSTPERPVFNRTLTLKDSWAKLQAKGA